MTVTWDDLTPRQQRLADAVVTYAGMSAMDARDALDATGATGFDVGQVAAWMNDGDEAAALPYVTDAAGGITPLVEESADLLAEAEMVDADDAERRADIETAYRQGMTYEEYAHYAEWADSYPASPAAGADAFEAGSEQAGQGDPTPTRAPTWARYLTGDALRNADPETMTDDEFADYGAACEDDAAERWVAGEADRHQAQMEQLDAAGALDAGGSAEGLIRPMNDPGDPVYGGGRVEDDPDFRAAQAEHEQAGRDWQAVSDDYDRGLGGDMSWSQWVDHCAQRDAAPAGDDVYRAPVEPDADGNWF